MNHVPAIIPRTDSQAIQYAIRCVGYFHLYFIVIHSMMSCGAGEVFKGPHWWRGFSWGGAGGNTSLIQSNSPCVVNSRASSFLALSQ